MPDFQKRCELLTRENDELRDRVFQLEELLGINFDAPAFLSLSATEAKLFGMLLARDAVTKSGAMDAIYGDRPDCDAAEEKIIDVYICKLRKKLEPFDLSIETAWGQGYSINESNKRRARELIEQDKARAA